MSSVFADPDLAGLFGVLLVVLSLSTLVGRILLYKKKSQGRSEVLENLNQRLNTWWLLIGLFSLSVMIGKQCSVLLFAAISFLALREFLTICPTRKADHLALLTGVLIVLPCQYYLVATGWYGLFAIFIPVYASVVIPLMCAVGGDNRDFLSRIARIQWCYLLCIYFVSHAPAILMLDLGGVQGAPVKLLCFLAVVVQISDVAQYVVGKAIGRTPLSKSVSPNKTLEGFVGGIIVAGGCGALMHGLTPFVPVEAFCVALLISVLGTGGDLVLSAVKRDSGIKDYSRILPGHGGILDRVDSICFAAPVFFHITRYLFAS